MYNNDNRIVITLDAGGTNLVFGAMKGCEYIGETVTLPSMAKDLDQCLSQMVKGFETIIGRLEEKPVAISFAFPGPADYANGIVGGFLPNFPSFRDGVALGPFLSKKFGLPVFINNDGDLFAFGEAMAGALPWINSRVAAMGGDRQYKNLLGYTFGTGLGETRCLPYKYDRSRMIEDHAAIRAIVRVYGELTGNPDHGLTPKDICDIIEGRREGDREAALAVTLTDSLIVLGGGLTGAARYILPSLLEELRSQIKTIGGDTLNRVQMKVYNLDDPEEFEKFVHGQARRLKVYGTDDYVTYDPQKRTGVCVSRLGASRAISIGAYAYALSRLDLPVTR